MNKKQHLESFDPDDRNDTVVTLRMHRNTLDMTIKAFEIAMGEMCKNTDYCGDCVERLLNAYRAYKKEAELAILQAARDKGVTIQ